jgi:exonuclease III
MEGKTENKEMGLAIYSFNVRGMRNANKRKKIFTYLKQKCRGVIFLQETYTQPDDINTWKKEWGQHVYLNHGTTHSCGVAILVTKGYDFQPLDTRNDTNGRYIYINATVNGTNKAFLNYYSPTSEKVTEQIKLLEQVTEIVINNSSILFWGGDFNMSMSKDDKDRNFDKPSKFVTKITQLLEDADMGDIWRIMNPDIKRYTWRRCTMQNITQSRLDYIFAPYSCIYRLKKTDILPSICSDHNMITLELEEENITTNGRGFWKFNSSLLHEKDYVERINNLIQECKTKYADCANLALKWDTIKMEIRGQTVSYASYRAKKKRTRKHTQPRNTENRRTNG